MKISNVRWGLATNSSSTHSIILDPSISEDDSRLTRPTPEDGYGWDDFLLRKREDKAAYMACQVYQNLISNGLPPTYARHTVRSLFAANVAGCYEDAYGIDDQSVLALPCRYPQGYQEIYSHALTDLDFAKELYDYVVASDRVAVAGGNDNQYDHEKVPYGGVTLLEGLGRDYGQENKQLVCRKDGDWWALFNRKTGAKVRLSFVEGATPYERATTPELVDMKLTDYCPYGCDFCYQGSTLGGRHANYKEVTKALGALGNLQVFEIAFGGGETTMHPDFARILRDARQVGMTPNFTTFDMRWAKDAEIVDAVIECCGGFAVSLTDYAKSFEKVEKACRWEDDHSRMHRTTGDWNGKASFQSVLGLMHQDSLLHLIKHIGKGSVRRLTLLGYKAYGRGLETIKTAHPINLGDVLDCCVENYVSLGIDTLVVQQYGKALDEAKVSNLLRTNREGAFSMYVDAVAKTIARDSYTDAKVTYTCEDYKTDLCAKIMENFPYYA